MKRTRFGDIRIISIVKEAAAGGMVKVIGRRHGVSDTTIYNWKPKYGGMGASEL